MACVIPSFVNNCDTSCSGSLGRFWIANVKDVDLDAIIAGLDVNGKFTSINMIGTGVFSEWQYQQDTLNLNSALTVEGCKATYTHTLAGNIQCVNPDNIINRSNIAQCFCCGVVVIFEDTNGDLYILGHTKGRPVKNMTMNAIVEATIDGRNDFEVSIEWITNKEIGTFVTGLTVPV